MRHRLGIASLTGLGNSSSPFLDNKGVVSDVIKQMLQEAIQTFPLMRENAGFEIRDVVAHILSFIPNTN